VIFAKGIYHFKDGNFDVGGRSTIRGKGITLYFSGKKSRLIFRNATRVNLTASESGPMAGFLVYADQSVDPKKVFRVQSIDAKSFTGLVYTPGNKFKIGDDSDGDGNCDIGKDDDDGDDDDDEDDITKGCKSSIGQFSDWTAIVARKIQVTSGVELALNTNYGDSSVPVPNGIGPVGTKVRLSK